MNTILNPASNSGIRSATVTLLPPLAVVVHNPSLISKEQLVSEISDGGYGAEIVSSSLVTTTDASTTNERTVKLRIDGFFCSCVLPSFLPGFPSLTPTPQQLLNRRQRSPLLLRFHRLAPLLHASLPRRSHHDPYLHPLPDLHPPHPPPPHHLSRPLHPHPSTHLLRPLRPLLVLPIPRKPAPPLPPPPHHPLRPPDLPHRYPLHDSPPAFRPSREVL